MRARLAISRAGVQVELREILLRDKAPTFLETSPKGTVPVLVLPDGQVVDESFDIMNWALGANGSNPEEKDLVRRCDSEFKPWLDGYKYPNKFPELSKDHVILNAGIYLDALEIRLESSAFLFGETRGYADIGIAPFVRQFANVDTVWFQHSKWTRVREWYQEFIDWDGFKTIMHKYPKWELGDDISVFGAKNS